MDAIFSTILSTVTGAELWVHMAASFYVAGFLVRDQLWLRSLILCGTCCYMGYYFFVNDTPLWDAFIWSCIMGVANLSMIIRIALERTTFAMSEEERSLFQAFEGLSPGEFRKLLKFTHWRTADGKRLLTVENEKPDRLFYMLDGTIQISKRGTAFSVSRPGFIGEISYTLDQNASATVLISEGGRYVYWNKDDLAKIELKQPAIRVALARILNADLAKKVAKSVGEW